MSLAPAARAQEAPTALPSFAQLEKAGARIGEIRIRNRDIFDTDDPAEDKLLFRWANALHMQTREGVIRRLVLLKPGQPVTVNLIEETERVLRSVSYLYDVQLRPLAYADGVVDIEVETRDTWTLDPGFSASRTGGTNASSINIREFNLLGTGIGVSYGYAKNVDRSSNEFQILNEHAFDGWTSLRYTLANNSDGRKQAFGVAHPFYALDTPWAAGASVSDDDRIDAVYNGGVVLNEYRRRERLAEAYGGWSAGRVDGWGAALFGGRDPARQPLLARAWAGGPGQFAERRKTGCTFRSLRIDRRPL